jgi:hypothetical protein
MLERQEIFCHNCQKHVQFDLDVELNCNHILNCPNCNHEHCRVVQDGVVTGNRWDSRNSIYNVSTTTATWTTIGTYNTYIPANAGTTQYTVNNVTYDASLYTYMAWSNTIKVGGSS